MTVKKGRRAGNVADRTVQYALVGRVLVHWFIFTVATCFFMLMSHALFSRGSGTAPRHFFSNYLSEILPFLLVATFLLPVFMVDVNKLSHRFAGPMIRFRRYMRDVTQGKDVPELKFRPGDFWREIATDFNNVIASVNAVRGESGQDESDESSGALEEVAANQ